MIVVPGIICKAGPAASEVSILQATKKMPFKRLVELPIVPSSLTAPLRKPSQRQPVKWT